MRYLGIVSITVFLSLVFASTHPTFADDGSLPILQLAFRDHIVTISSSPKGRLYSVSTTSGVLLSEDLTDEQLLAAHPRLHSHIRSSYAGEESGSFIWAGRSESMVEPAGDAITHPE